MLDVTSRVYDDGKVVLSVKSVSSKNHVKVVLNKDEVTVDANDLIKAVENAMTSVVTESTVSEYEAYGLRGRIKVESTDKGVGVTLTKYYRNSINETVSTEDKTIEGRIFIQGIKNVMNA